MERLLAKMGTPSYLPTPAEVIDGVRWLRENPALAAGVVVGLTSYSMAKYYEYKDDDEPDAEDDAPAEATDDAPAKLTARATREEIARSVSALQLGLLKVHVRGRDREDSTASTESSHGSSSGLRSRASSIFDRVHFEEPVFPNHAVNPAKSCVHGGECPPDKPCCDPDWGWFVPTSPTHRRVAK